MRTSLARNPLPLAAAAAGLALLATAALAAAAVARALSATGGAGGDFLSFYAAGHMVRGDAARLYDIAAQAATQRALYPGALPHATGYPLPVAAAWAFAPLTALPFAAAYAAWLAVNIALLATVARTLAGELRGVPPLPRRVFVAAAVTSMPVVADLVFGQVDLLLLAAMLGGWLLLRSGKPAHAGALLAVLAIKPQFLLGIAPMLLVTRQWRALAWLCAAGAALLVVPALLTDPETLAANVRYLAHYPGAGNDLQVNAAMMSNWRGLIVSVTGRDDAWLWAPGLAVIAGGALAAAVRRWAADGRVTAQGFALAALLPLLAAPHLHTQSLALLWLAAALALGGRYSLPPRDDGRRAAAALLALHAALFAVWLSTALGFAPGVILIGACYTWCACRWSGAAAAAARASAPAAARAA